MEEKKKDILRTFWVVMTIIQLEVYWYIQGSDWFNALVSKLLSKQLNIIFFNVSFFAWIFTMFLVLIIYTVFYIILEKGQDVKKAILNSVIILFFGIVLGIINEYNHIFVVALIVCFMFFGTVFGLWHEIRQSRKNNNISDADEI